MKELIRLQVENLISSSNLFKIMVNKNKKKATISQVARDTKEQISDLKKTITDSTYEWLVSGYKLGEFPELSKRIEEDIREKFELETLKMGIIQDFGDN